MFSSRYGRGTLLCPHHNQERKVSNDGWTQNSAQRLTAAAKYTAIQIRVTGIVQLFFHLGFLLQSLRRVLQFVEQAGTRLLSSAAF